MNTTERLYYVDSHLTEFQAQVSAVTRDEGGRTAVMLDRTAFYPTGGGQPSDTGMLGGARVTDCIDDETAGVLHFIDGKIPEAGDEIEGRIDWPRRFDHIQQHTAQHILSQAFVALFGAETHGFRMLERVSEIDVKLPEPTDQRIEQAVELANRIVWDNRPVHVHNVTAEEAASMPLRRESARVGLLRVVEIEGFDMNACGGTHARRTGEVGVIAIRSWERAKGMTRITFVAGGRALADYGRANATAREVAAIFSVGRDDSPAAVARLLEENKGLVRRVRALEEIALRIEAQELIGDSAHQRSDGVRIIARTFDERDAEVLKKLALFVVAQPQTIALLASRDGDSARLIFARSADTHDDMNALMREACVMLDGRGGGRADLAQGGGPSVAKTTFAIETILRRLMGEF